MLYAWIGLLRPDAGHVSPLVQQQTSDFLRQPLIKIHTAGPLRGPLGERAGMMMLFEHESREGAQAFVADSPFLRAGLYENHLLYEYDNEIG